MAKIFKETHYIIVMCHFNEMGDTCYCHAQYNLVLNKQIQIEKSYYDKEKSHYLYNLFFQNIISTTP